MKFDCCLNRNCELINNIVYFLNRSSEKKFYERGFPKTHVYLEIEKYGYNVRERQKIKKRKGAPDQLGNLSQIFSRNSYAFRVSKFCG